MKALKFGGTSVKSAEMMSRITNIVKDSDEEQIVVVSAMGGATDSLLNASEKALQGNQSYKEDFDAFRNRHLEAINILFSNGESEKITLEIQEHLNRLEDLFNGIYLTRDISNKTKDKIVSMGELLSSKIIAKNFQKNDIDCQWLDSRELIVTDSNYGNARVDKEKTFQNIKTKLKGHKVFLLPGFIARDAQGNPTTLGRGGSDYSASLYAAAMDANILEIWTDVSGMMTADPRKVPRAIAVEQISYAEAMELSHFGAKVIYPPTILPVLKKSISIQIKNTFKPEDSGTLISTKPDERISTLSGISSIDDISLISIEGSGLQGVSGMASRLFQTVSREKINIILITQGSSEHSITFALLPTSAAAAKVAIEEEFELELQLGLIDPIRIEEGLSVLAAVGENMKNIPGISATFFEALGRNGINVKAIAQGASELNISVVINKYDVRKALNAIHEAFFLSDTKTANIFIAGTGTIGSTLLNQIKEQQEKLLAENGLDLRIVGITNSRKMLFRRECIDPSNWNHDLDENGVKADIEVFCEKMMEMNMRNSIFIDNTAHSIVTDKYENIFNASISIVTPNKIANASNIDRYKSLHKMAGKYGVRFLYETNVGAGLPIISTLKDLIKSGDKIIRIEAMLSGSLNYIFSKCDDEHSFYDVVKEAHELGYTEPDPRIDLSGVDVARKILILSRESGLDVNLEDIEIENCLTKNSQNASNMDEFWKSLEAHDNPSFEEKRKAALNENKRLKYVAKLENGRASTAIQALDESHPFYTIQGTGNIVSFKTERYKEIPLVVIGPGAGAEVTAAGVFADIIRIANV